MDYFVSTVVYFHICCTLFLTSEKGSRRGTEKLKRLITEPLTQFSKLLENDGLLETHQNNDYHKNCVQFSFDFQNFFFKSEQSCS